MLSIQDGHRAAGRCVVELGTFSNFGICSPFYFLKVPDLHHLLEHMGFSTHDKSHDI
jgi:hypothetical protein